VDLPAARPSLIGVSAGTFPMSHAVRNVLRQAGGRMDRPDSGRVAAYFVHMYTYYSPMPFFSSKLDASRPSVAALKTAKIQSFNGTFQHAESY
jgi:hypothetical protein